MSEETARSLALAQCRVMDLESALATERLQHATFRAEAEKVREEVHQLILSLRAENARLRAAMEDFARGPLQVGDFGAYVQMKAKAALEVKP